MFRSLTEDLKQTFSYGNMITRLIIINAGVFVVTALVSAFLPAFYATSILPWIALPGKFSDFIIKPWTIISHMFLHQGLWHLIWNMLTLYWFGNIAGDLLGDKKILPAFFLGGLIGSFFFLLGNAFLAHPGSLAMGSSAAVLSIVFAAVTTAPEYRVHLILIGPVRIKFIGLFILFIDIIGTQSASNSGGHLAHLGGALAGFLFVYLLRSGIDLSATPSWFRWKKSAKPGNKKLKIAHKAPVLSHKGNTESTSMQVDRILEKIKLRGFDSLSAAEKEILNRASKEGNND